MIIEFPSKDPAEIVPLGVQFHRLTDAISAATWSVSVKQGSDPAVGSMLVGAATTAGAETTHYIGGGVSGCVYQIRVDIQDPHGGQFSFAADMAVNTLT